MEAKGREKPVCEGVQDTEEEIQRISCDVDFSVVKTWRGRVHY
jgi:hypothetical protein